MEVTDKTTMSCTMVHQLYFMIINAINAFTASEVIRVIYMN